MTNKKHENQLVKAIVAKIPFGKDNAITEILNKRGIQAVMDRETVA